MPLLRALLFALIVYILSFIGLYWGVGVQVFEEDNFKGGSDDSEYVYAAHGMPVFYIQLRNYARLSAEDYRQLNPSARCLSDWLAYLGGSKKYVQRHKDLIQRAGILLHQSSVLQASLHALMKEKDQNELRIIIQNMSLILPAPELDSLHQVFENAPKDGEHLLIVPQWVGKDALCHQWLFSNDFNSRMAGSYSLLEGMKWSLALGILSFVFTSVLGLLWGLNWASDKRKGVWQSLSLFFYAVPSFAWALLVLTVLLLFADTWYWPMNDPGPLVTLILKNPLEVLLRLSLPAFCLSLMPSAYIAGLWRQAIEQEHSQEYVLTARAKGLSEVAILYRHILKNAAFPVLTASALLLPGMLTGSLVMETLFSIPGLGRLMHLAYLQRDFNTLLWIFPIVATAVILLWQFMQVLYQTIDPRI